MWMRPLAKYIERPDDVMNLSCSLPSGAELSTSEKYAQSGFCKNDSTSIHTMTAFRLTGWTEE